MTSPAAPDPSAGDGAELTADDGVAVVAAAACRQDPGLPPETASMLARTALGLLDEVGPDAPEIARRLLAAHEGVGASPANAVATAAARSAGAGPAPA